MGSLFRLRPPSLSRDIKGGGAPGPTHPPPGTATGVNRYVITVTAANSTPVDLLFERVRKRVFNSLLFNNEMENICIPWYLHSTLIELFIVIKLQFLSVLVFKMLKIL